MSLILDALRKLERDKHAREPGVVVVGSVPWGGGRSRRSRVLALAAAAVLALLGGWWLLRGTPAREAGAPAATPSAASPPAPRVLPAASPLAPVGAAPSAAIAPSPRELALPAPRAAPEAAFGGPEARASAPPSLSDDVRLTAVSRKDGRPVALINDRLVFEGDSFDGIKVLRIGEAEVEVEVRGQRRTLRF